MPEMLAHISHYVTGASTDGGGNSATINLPSRPQDLAAWGLVIIVMWLVVRSARRTGL
jgi:hypothetical protein